MIWRFPEIGVPPAIIHSNGILHDKPSSYWGYPQLCKPPFTRETSFPKSNTHLSKCFFPADHSLPNPLDVSVLCSVENGAMGITWIPWFHAAPCAMWFTASSSTTEAGTWARKQITRGSGESVSIVWIRMKRLGFVSCCSITLHTVWPESGDFRESNTCDILWSSKYGSGPFFASALCFYIPTPSLPIEGDGGLENLRGMIQPPQLEFFYAFGTTSWVCGQHVRGLFEIDITYP